MQLRILVAKKAFEKESIMPNNLLIEEVENLRSAISFVNDVIKAEEGVDLIYYMDLHGLKFTNLKAFVTIKEIIESKKESNHDLS